VTAMNWYTSVLSRIVKPVVTQYDEIVKATFFGFYGGDYDNAEGCTMDETTKTDLTNRRVLFIRLRICLSERKNEVKNRLDEIIHQHNTDLIKTHEDCIFRVETDLGNRYAKTSDNTISEERLLNFINYWNGACRYILSILVNDKLDNTVDIWGVPHLTNNSLGTKFNMNFENEDLRRRGRTPAYLCPKCGETLYMDTNRVKRFYLCPTCLQYVLESIGNI